MNEISLAVGSLIYLILGGFHGVLALRDVSSPKTFTPTDASVRNAMKGVPIALHPNTDLWKAWLGFNLSHSLGLMVFGGSLLGMAVFHADLFTNSLYVQTAAVTVSAVYFVLSVKFWFSAPAIGSGIATLCILAAGLLSL